MNCLIRFSSLTLMQKAKNILNKNQIIAKTVQVPASISHAGCSFALSIGDEDLSAAIVILQTHQISYQKILYQSDSKNAKYYDIS